MTARQLEQRDFHWPHGLYESAPFVYIAAGLWVNFQLDGPVAAIASAFLVLAGLGILYLRWTYRRFAYHLQVTLQREMQDHITMTLRFGCDQAQHTFEHLVAASRRGGGRPPAAQ